MQLSVTNSMSFKSQYQDYDYGYDYDCEHNCTPEYFDDAIKTLDEAQDKFVPSSDIKKPLPLFIAFSTLVSKLGFKGAATALLIDQTTKNKASKSFNDGLKQTLNKTQEFGEKLIQGKEKGLFKKIKKSIGESIENSSEQFSKVIAKNSATKNFSIAAAIVSVLAFAPKAIAADNNKDGINDIAQYSQVYDDSSAQLDRLQENASTVGRLLALVT